MKRFVEWLEWHLGIGWRHYITIIDEDRRTVYWINKRTNEIREIEEPLGL